MARSPTDQEIRTQPGTAWLTWQTVTPLIMNIGRRHMKPVLGFHTTSWMSVTCIVAKHLHSLIWFLVFCSCHRDIVSVVCFHFELFKVKIFNFEFHFCGFGRLAAFFFVLSLV